MFDPNMSRSQVPIELLQKPKKTKLRKAWELIRAGLVVLGAFTLVKGCHKFLYGYNASYLKRNNNAAYYKLYTPMNRSVSAVINEYDQSYKHMNYSIDSIINENKELGYNEVDYSIKDNICDKLE